MDAKSFLKLCKDCDFIDRKLTARDVDLVFMRIVGRGARRIRFPVFKEALKIIAEKRGMAVEELEQTVVDMDRPIIHGTKAEAVRFHDDEARENHDFEVLDVVAAARAPSRKVTSERPQSTVMRQNEGEYLSLREAFTLFSGGRLDIDGPSFLKLCRDSNLLDKTLSTTDVDLIFSKVVGKGRRRVGYSEFQEALYLVAEHKKLEYFDVMEMIAKSGGPAHRATKSEDVRFYARSPETRSGAPSPNRRGVAPSPERRSTARSPERQSVSIRTANSTMAAVTF